MIGAGNSCLDMCDTKIALSVFHDTPGKEAGTLATVQSVRSGRDPEGLTTCPGPSVWTWLWFPILLCCLIGLCAFAYKAFDFYRTRLRKSNQKKNQPYESDQFVEDQPYVDYNQVAPQAPQTQDYMPEPMPVYMEPEAPAAPAYFEEQPMQTPLFGEPHLMPMNPMGMSGLAPQTVAMPMTTSQYGYAGAPVTTSYPQMAGYPQQTSMGARGMPQTTSMGYGGSMATAMPAYSAYGAYGQNPTATYPGGSMRIG